MTWIKRIVGSVATKVAPLMLAVCAVLPSQADVVLEWNALALDCIRVDNSAPTLSTRNLALLHAAVYDAVNSVTRTHQPYRFQLGVPANTSTEAAAVAAAHQVLSSLYPSLDVWTDDLYALWLGSVAHDEALTNGIVMGRLVAGHLLELRRDDGATTEVPYVPSAAPGQWQRTPPFFRPPLTPHWRYLEPFCVDHIEDFVPGPPPPLDSADYAAAVNEVKAIGAKNSRVRTAEQSQIAVFWSDFSYTAMPPGHWHEIAASIARARTNTLAGNARMFALLSLAQADAAIVCWEAKYRYNLWRPVTAIQRAAEDGNAATEAQTDWDQFLAAPPFPAYTSGHSTFSMASAQVLTRFYNTDVLTFDVTSDSLPGVVRTFQSLASCADEVGRSRIYGGIHFEFDNRAGKECGARIADWVVANYLLANDQLPRLACSPHEQGLQLRIHSRAGQVSVLESATRFDAWQPVQTNLYRPGGWPVWILIAPSEVCRFFRMRL